METRTDAAAEQDASTPPEKPARAFFSAIFDAVLDEIERNPDFAERLGARLSAATEGRVALTVKRRRRRLDAPPAALAEIDLAAEYVSGGQFDLMEKLQAFTNAELAALVKSRDLTSDPVSKLTKSQLLNLLVRHAAGR